MSEYKFNFLALPEHLLTQDLNEHGFHFGIPDNIGDALQHILSNQTRSVTYDTIPYESDMSVPNEKILVPIGIKEWVWDEVERQLSEVFKAIPKPVLHQLQSNPNFSLLLLNPTEPHTFNFIQCLNTLLTEFGIPLDKAILCVCDFTLKERLRKNNIITPNNYKKGINILQVNNLWGRVFLNTAILTPPKFKEEREKKYISLNRRPSPHRCSLIALLYENDLLSEGYVTFRTDLYPNMVYDSMISGHSNWFNENKQLKLGINDNLKDMEANGKLPLTIEPNEELLTVDMMWVTTDTIFKCHEESYFTLLTESFLYNYDDCCFMSEKTLKPMLMMHPFVMFGGYRSLEKLRSMGFQTFSPWINEDYDLKENYIDRFSSAWQQAIRLINMPKKQLSEMLYEMLPILEWNRNRVLNEFPETCQTTDYPQLLKWANINNSSYINIKEHTSYRKNMRLIELKEQRDLVLKSLPYAKSDLEPYMSEETLEYHYSKLAEGYVSRYNNNIGDSEFNRAGAYLHELFFDQFSSPEKNNDPFGAVKDLVESNFETFKNFKHAFKTMALNIQGSGWVCLTKNGELRMIENHEMVDDIVLLIDMWEHAYVLDYKQDKKHYIDNFWKLLNWDVINKRL